jgi:hypothetical protein
MGIIKDNVYGRSPSGDGSNELKRDLGIVYTVAGVVFVILIVYVVLSNNPAAKQTVAGLASSVTAKVTGASSSGVGSVLNNPEQSWRTFTIVFLFALFVTFVGIYIDQQVNKGKYRSTVDSAAELIGVRRTTISRKFGELGNTAAGKSATRGLTQKPRGVPYNQIKDGDARLALVNWRPLTVRLAGYLGGVNSIRDGVFDMSSGIEHAMHLGARGFVFDIDYLDVQPCHPVVAFRDSGGILRSINTGAIKDGMDAIANKAFAGDQPNYDPILIIIYLRRIPPGNTQKKLYMQNIAKALDPLTEYHLGQTQEGNYHNCLMEDGLFYTPITEFQKKFIILTNYNTSSLPATPNPKDNLHWWTHARIYADPDGASASLGSVTEAPPASPAAYAHVGDLTNLLNIGLGKTTDDYLKISKMKFKIALGPPEVPVTASDLSRLMNGLGIQCVPIDVIAMGMSDNYKLCSTTATNLTQLSDLQCVSDPLSFWTFGGWSRKKMADETTDTSGIPAFIIDPPTVPSKPSGSMNSGGGGLSIS